jgi:hypothetical protein
LVLIYEDHAHFEVLEKNGEVKGDLLKLGSIGCGDELG